MEITLEKQADVESKPVPLLRILLVPGQSIQDFFLHYICVCVRACVCVYVCVYIYI